jgi:hypothetical protein
MRNEYDIDIVKFDLKLTQYIIHTHTHIFYFIE